MATAEVIPTIPDNSSARLLEPGVSEVGRVLNPVLPPQGGDMPSSNVLVQFLSPNELPDTHPAQVQFGAIRDPQLRVVRPIPLNVSIEESTVLVCWSAIDEFGTGGTLSSAIDDFSSGLRELYWHLFSPEVKLGDDLQKVRSTLEEYIQLRK